MACASMLHLNLFDGRVSSQIDEILEKKDDKFEDDGSEMRTRPLFCIASSRIHSCNLIHAFVAIDSPAHVCPKGFG